MAIDSSLKKQSISGIFWRLLEQVGSQLVSMIIQIVLARLLLPDDYGDIGYLTIFIAIVDVFLKQGFTTALIQKQDAGDIDNSTVFFANIALSVILYYVLFSIAPFVSEYYREPKLVAIMRVFSLTTIIGSLSAVHEALIAKGLAFRKSFVRGLANTTTYGLVGILCAYKGFGVWSLVFGRLAGTIVGVIILWVAVKWKPKFIFSWKSLKTLFGFSSGVLATNLLETIFHNIHTLFIGRMYTSSDLGYYQRGQGIPQLVMGTVDGTMSEVMYPTFSIIQNDLTKLKATLKRSIKTSMYVCLPLLTGLMITARPLTIILLTEKWLPSVPYMQLMCVVTMFWPLSARLHALKAIGLSKLTFKISLVNNLVYVFVTLSIAKFGPLYIMIAAIISNIFGLIYSSIYVNKYIGYSLTELFLDVLPPFVLTVIMALIVYLFSLLSLSYMVTFVLQVFMGIVVYVVGSVALKIDSFYYIWDIILKFVVNGVKYEK